MVDPSHMFIVVQRYYHRYKPEFEKITAEECQKRNYARKGYHKDNAVDKEKGFYDLHVSGFKTEEEADEFIAIVKNG